MRKDRQGRRGVSIELAREHQLPQESIAATNAVVCGCPLFVVDTTELTEEEVFNRTSEILAKLGVS